MVDLLRSERVRVLLLNATLLLMFASAWVSDRWPELTLPAIGIAFVVVIGEAILLYVAAKQVASKTSLPKGVEKDDVQRGHLPADAVLEHRDDEREDYERAFALRRHHHALVANRYVLHALRPRASRASTWALAALHEDRSLYLVIARELELRLVKDLELRLTLNPERARPLSPELAKWQVITHSDEAFNIVAGAFEIEYFHGRTNIRVLDSSRVTVEGESRGAKSKIAPSDVSPIVYQ